MHKQSYRYSLGMMTLMLLADVNAAGSTSAVVSKAEND